MRLSGPFFLILTPLSCGCGVSPILHWTGWVTQSRSVGGCVGGSLGLRGSLYYYWCLIFIQKDTLVGEAISLVLRFSLFPNFSLSTLSSCLLWPIIQALSLAFSLSIVHISSFCSRPGWIWKHKSLRCDTLLSGLLIICPHAVCLLWLSVHSGFLIWP